MSHRRLPSLIVNGLVLAIVLISVVLLLGLLGKLHPAFDSLSHFRAHLAAAMGAIALGMLVATSFRREALMVLVFPLAMLASTFAYNKAESANSDAVNSFTFMQFNTRFDNSNLLLLISVLNEYKPDIVTLQEVTPRTERWLEKVRKTYPYQHVCDSSRLVGGAAILSKFPWTTDVVPVCKEDGYVASATLDLAGISLEVAAIHLHWPWPFQQPMQTKRLGPFLKTLGPKAIIAGDFNATPWSATMQRIASDSATGIVSAGPTWLKSAVPKSLRPIAGLPIDHILVKGVGVHGSAVRLRDAGSDHLPIFARISISTH